MLWRLFHKASFCRCLRGDAVIHFCAQVGGKPCSRPSGAASGEASDEYWEGAGQNHGFSGAFRLTFSILFRIFRLPDGLTGREALGQNRLVYVPVFVCPW
jgi:hypothetical protein